MRLRLALGVNCRSSRCLAIHPITGILAYPASATIVFFDIKKSKQVGYVHELKQPISCLDFSSDGRFLLAGESGHKPAVHVWDIHNEKLVTSLREHTYGITCAAFSPTMDVIVSIGNKFDRLIVVYSWPDKIKLALNRFAENIVDMAFSADGNHFVTTGRHHVKFWYPLGETGQRKAKDPQALYGRPALLGNLKNYNFVAISTGTKKQADCSFVVTKCGYVCKIMTSTRSIACFKRLDNIRLSCVRSNGDNLLVSSISGQIYILDANNLSIQTYVSTPQEMGFSDSIGTNNTLTNLFTVDPVNNMLVVTLSNGSICIYDISDLQNIKNIHYSVSHSKGITSLDTVHSIDSGKQGDRQMETVVTVSADSTLRMWYISLDREISCESSKTMYRGSEEAPSSDAILPQNQTSKSEPQPSIVVTKVSPDNKFVAVGDSVGVISVYSGQALETLHSKPHHSKSVTCLDFHYSRHSQQKLFASGGRDRIINIYDVSKNFSVLNTLRLHSGTITGLLINTHFSGFSLFSTALDRCLAFSISTCGNTPEFKPSRCRKLASSAVDVLRCEELNHVVLGQLNGTVYAFNAESGFEMFKFAACFNRHVHLEKLHLESNNALLLLSACSNRTVNVLSYPGGNLLTTVCGHAKPVSGLAFSHNLRYAISSSMDGCLLFWRLPRSLIELSQKLKRIHSARVLEGKGDQLKEKEDWIRQKHYQKYTKHHALRNRIEMKRFVIVKNSQGDSKDENVLLRNVERTNDVSQSSAADSMCNYNDAPDELTLSTQSQIEMSAADTSAITDLQANADRNQVKEVEINRPPTEESLTNPVNFKCFNEHETEKSQSVHSLNSDSMDNKLYAYRNVGKNNIVEQSEYEDWKAFDEIVPAKLINIPRPAKRSGEPYLETLNKQIALLKEIDSASDSDCCLMSSSMQCTPEASNTDSSIGTERHVLTSTVNFPRLNGGLGFSINTEHVDKVIHGDELEKMSEFSGNREKTCIRDKNIDDKKYKYHLVSESSESEEMVPLVNCEKSQSTLSESISSDDNSGFTA